MGLVQLKLQNSNQGSNKCLDYFHVQYTCPSLYTRIELIDTICNEPLELTPTSFPLLPATPSYMHAFHESLGDIRGYNPSFDPYCAHLEDVPQKIM